MTRKKEHCEIVLKFGDKETVDYIDNVCRRKGVDLESYIIDNFEWDDLPECLNVEAPKKITHKMCAGCEYIDRCPDAVVKA